LAKRLGERTRKGTVGSGGSRGCDESRSLRREGKTKGKRESMTNNQGSRMGADDVGGRSLFEREVNQKKRTFI